MRQRRRNSGDGRLHAIELIDRVLRDPLRTPMRPADRCDPLPLLALTLLAASHSGISCVGVRVPAATGLD
jgi:hypothetical protein